MGLEDSGVRPASEGSGRPELTLDRVNSGSRQPAPAGAEREAPRVPESLAALSEGYESAAQAARRLGVGAAWVRKMCAAGRMPGALKVGRDWFVREGSVPLRRTHGALPVWDGGRREGEDRPGSEHPQRRGVGGQTEEPAEEPAEAPSAARLQTNTVRMMDGGRLLPEERPAGVPKKGYERLVAHVRDTETFRSIGHREGVHPANVQTSVENAARRILELAETGSSRPARKA